MTEETGNVLVWYICQ